VDYAVGRAFRELSDMDPDATRLVLMLHRTVGMLVAWPVAVEPVNISLSMSAWLDRRAPTVLGGAFAPTIAQILVRTTGTSVSVGVCIMVLCVISFVAVSLVKETRGAPLGLAESRTR
jgi:hypothetical protein